METLEKKLGFVKEKMPVNLKTISIKEPAYKSVDSKKEESLSVYDMAEYSCDAGGPCQCHCATY
jgi:hypothetical protein